MSELIELGSSSSLILDFCDFEEVGGMRYKDGPQ